jgi:hypothetical protein
VQRIYDQRNRIAILGKRMRFYGVDLDREHPLLLGGLAPQTIALKLDIGGASTRGLESISFIEHHR